MGEIEADAHVTMHARIAGSRQYVRVTAFYRREDPYAIGLVFDDCAGTQTIWYFARDLAWETFVYGKSAGIGDIRLCLVDHDMVLLRMTAPVVDVLAQGPLEDSMEVLIARRPFASMLRRSAIAVPPGAEFHHVDVDQWIEQMLRECR